MFWTNAVFVAKVQIRCMVAKLVLEVQWIKTLGTNQCRVVRLEGKWKRRKLLKERDNLHLRVISFFLLASEYLYSIE